MGSLQAPNKLGEGLMGSPGGWGGGVTGRMEALGSLGGG